MAITKRDDVKNKVSAKHSEENSVFGEVSYYYLFLFLGSRGKGVGAYLSLSGREVGWGGALIRGWALINFFRL